MPSRYHEGAPIGQRQGLSITKWRESQSKRVVNGLKRDETYLTRGKKGAGGYEREECFARI